MRGSRGCGTVGCSILLVNAQTSVILADLPRYLGPHPLRDDNMHSDMSVPMLVTLSYRTKHTELLLPIHVFLRARDTPPTAEAFGRGGML